MSETDAAADAGEATRSAPSPAAPAPSPGRRFRRLLPRDRPLAIAGVVLIVVGFLVRLALMLRGGGLLGIGAYDDGVYYTAAAQLLHGRLPYRDYLFVQPPGIVPVLVPFAALGRLVGDPAALVTMRLSFELLGGVNAALVLLVLRPFGLPAALVGGLSYAVLYPAAYDERTALLEPLGSTAVLVALLALGRFRDGGTARWATAAGVALGIAVDLKIWFLVPLLVLLGFARGARVRVLLGAVVAVVVGYLPFFLAAPAASFRQIVLDQLGRSRSGTMLSRFESFLGVDGTGAFSTVPRLAPATAALVGAMLLGVLITVIWADRRARVFVALLAASILVLMAAPSYFQHYASLVALPLALVFGVGAGRAIALVRRGPLRVAALVGVLVLVVALNVRHDLQPADRTVPVAGLQAAAQRVSGCIYSDEPTLLAVMGVLTRDLDRGCAVQPDMSGISFDPAGHPPGNARIARTRNAVYQGEVLRYLRSGSAFIAVRPGASLSAGTKRELARSRPLFSQGPWVLRAVQP